MTIQQIEYFIRLCEIKNISAAAEQLHVSQPVISRQMLALEKELDLKLFNRFHKGVEPTEAGKIMSEFFTKASEQYHKALLEAGIKSAHSPGEYRISALESLVTPRVRAVQKKISEEKKTDIVIELCMVPIGGNELLTGGKDLVITFADMIPAISEISTLVLSGTYDCIFASERTATADPERLTWEDCSGKTIYMAEPNSSTSGIPPSHPLNRIVHHPKLKNAKFVFLPNNRSVFEQVRSGLGLGIQNSAGLINNCAGYKTMLLQPSSDIVVAWKTADTRPVVQQLVQELAKLNWDMKIGKAAGAVED